MKNNNKIINLYTFLILNIFLLSSIYWSIFPPSYGDTLNYKNTYDNIVLYQNPYGIEFTFYLLMLISKSLGFSFNFFILITLLLWLPTIITLIKFSLNNIAFLLIILFFISPKFFENATFLIRSFTAISILSIGIMTKNKYLKIIYYFAAFTTHTSIIIILLFYSNTLYNLFIRKKIIAFTLIFISFIMAIFLSPNMIVEKLQNIQSTISNDDIIRKISFYTSSTVNLSSPNPIIIYIAVAIMIIIALKSPKDSCEKKFDMLFFSQAFICVAMSQIGMISNRAGIIVFIFGLPILIYNTTRFKYII